MWYNKTHQVELPAGEMSTVDIRTETIKEAINVMGKTSLIAVSAVFAVLFAGCSTIDYPQHKGDSNVYQLNGAPKPFETGNPASAKYKAYVAPYNVNEERYGKQEFRTVKYSEFIKAALAEKFGGSLAFVDQPDHANIVIDMQNKESAFDLKSSAILYITAKVNGVFVTAKGQVFYRKPHWPPTSDDVASEVGTAADALVSVLKQMPDGTIGVSPLDLYEDKDTYYFSERNGVSVMQGAFGYNVAKRIEVD